MEKKAIAITDLSSCIKDRFSLPTIKPMYKGPSSGFIEKAKAMKTKNSVIYLPELQRTQTELQFQRSRSLSKEPASQSLASFHHNLRETFPGKSAIGNGPASRALNVDQKTLKLMSQSAADLSDMQVQRKDFHNPQRCYTIEFLNISQSLSHSGESPNRGVFPSKNTKPVPSGYMKPDFHKTTSSHLLQNPFSVAPQFQHFEARHKKSVPYTSFIVSGRSVVGKKTEKEGGQQPKWKSGCDCLRCDIIQKQYQDKEMSAYHMWGKYPCNHPETAHEAENYADSKT